MADATGSVKVRGMPISGNVIPAVMLCKTLGCGDMEMMNIMEGQHMTPEMLKINPWHQMPNMSDGDVHLGESGAIIRYVRCVPLSRTWPAVSPRLRNASGALRDRLPTNTVRTCTAVPT